MNKHSHASRAGHVLRLLGLCAALGGLAGCTGMQGVLGVVKDGARDSIEGLQSRFQSDPPDAVAKMESTTGNLTRGEVEFRQRGDVVKVTVRLKGLMPLTTHGFHVHDKGDCSSGDGMSTGGHFNPSGHQHGAQDSEHHAGDMPSLVSDASGKVETDFSLRGVSLGEGAANLIGHGVIVHQGPDDFKTQPTGNSGARISCGVIEAVKKTKS